MDRNEWTQRVLRLVGEYQSADDLYDHEAEWLAEFSADLARLADEMDAVAVRLEVASTGKGLD